MDTRAMHEMNIWQDPQLRPYLGEVRRKCGVVETLALPSLRDLPAIQIETLFVPPLLCTTPVHADDDPEEWPVGRNLFSELQEFKQIVVLGDPGGGKTTLSNWLAWRLTSGSSAPLPSVLENKIPFPCILREMPIGCFERGFSVADLAVAVVGKLLGSSKAEQLSPLVRRWVEEGNYVLILDGIDEVAVSRRQLIASWMREAHRQDAVVLATSRVVGYEDYSVDSENSSAEPGSSDLALHMEKARLTDVLKRVRSSVSHYQSGATARGKEWAKLRYLMPFNKTQISDFARNWYSQRCVSELEAKQRTSDLLASLAQSEITEKLARTPNLLSLMAIVHRERAHLPDGKALLYDEIVNAYLNTIDSQRRIGEETSLAQFGWKEKKSWLAYIGFKLQESRNWGSSTGILASEKQVIEWLEEAIQETEVDDYKSVAKEFLNWVARRSGLLLPRGESRYAFVHLSFQEYFCAYYLAGCIVRPAFVKDKISPDSPVTKAAVAAWGQHPAWLETYIFLFESLSAEHGFDWVETVIEIVFVNSGGTLANLAARLVKNKHVKLPSKVRDYLAIGCVPAVFGEADYKVLPDSEVFRILVENGYAAYISEDNDTYDRYSAGTLSAAKVLILIAVNGASLNAEFLSGFINLLALSVVDGFVDLSGLNRNSKLGSLRLRDAEVLNFNEVSYLKSIRSLELRRVEVTDISPLASLKELQVLEVSDIPVEDLSPLSKLRKINYLEVSWLKVDDLSPLSFLKKINTLCLYGLPATSVDFIGNLKFLYGLQISDMSLDSFEFFANCKKLESLDLTSMDFVDLAPFANLPKLEALFLSEINKFNISPVGMMKNLKMIMVEKLAINDLAELSTCKKLQSVYLKEVDLADVGSLADLKRIRALSLWRVPAVKDIGFLAGFKNLGYLDLRETEVKELSVLEKMQVPFSLRLSVNHKSDIDFLVEKEGFDIKLEDLEDEDN